MMQMHLARVEGLPDVNSASTCAVKKEVRIVKSVYSVQPIIDEVTWESELISVSALSTKNFTGKIDTGPGVYIVYGHMNHLNHEILGRTVSVKLLLQNSSNYSSDLPTEYITIEDTLNTESPRSASRFILTESVSWELQIHNHFFIPCHCEFMIVKRRGLDIIHKEKVETCKQQKLYASLFDRPFAGTETLPSYQRERVLSVLDQWPEFREHRILKFPINLSTNELQRNSIYKIEAFSKGLIRPFLLLVSMDPELRIQTGKTLGIDLIQKPYLGDSHHEAFRLLFKKRQGIQDRANYAFKEKLLAGGGSCNWYQIIYRVTRNAIKGSDAYTSQFKNQLKRKAKSSSASLNCCMDPENQEIFDMEAFFVSGLFETILDMQKEVDPEKYQGLQEEIKSPELDELVEKLKRCGFHNEQVLRVIALHVIKEGSFTKSLREVLEKWVDSKREGRAKDRFRLVVPLAFLGLQLTLLGVFSIISPMIVFPFAMLTANSMAYIFRDTPGKLLSPLITLCMQRVILACHDIRIKNYYPPKDSIPEYKEEPSLLFNLLNS